jgi:tetraacyldisaccharide 4'-kinase
MALVSTGEGADMEVREAGDEPFWLAETIKGAVVISCEDAYEAIQMAARQFQCQVAIVDDGIQDHGLYQDWKVFMLNARYPDANHHYWPLGPLRETCQSAQEKRGVSIVYHGLKQDLNRKAEIQTAYRLKGIRKQAEETFLENPTGPYYLWAGVAKPLDVCAFLETCGISVEKIIPALNHQLVTKDMFVACSKYSRNNKIMITEKDEQKILAILPSLNRFEIHVACIELDVVSGQLFLDHKIDEITYKISMR